MLDGNALGEKILEYIDNLRVQEGEEALADREKVFKAIGRAIVDYLKQNAEVYMVQMAPGTPVQVSTATGTGATTGPAQQLGTGKIK